MSDVISRDYRAWSLEDWNNRLVQAVFSHRGSTNLDLQRIDGTGQFLCSVANAPEAEAKDVRCRFLATFPSCWKEVANLFEPTSSVWQGWTADRPDLPFFAGLYLTVMVAAANQDTHDQGQFRDRFMTTLRLPKHTYFSHGLPYMWRLAAAWSKRQSELGEQVRTLILPDPGHESIIGYSKRLAFPVYPDQRRLAKLMKEARIDSEIPVQDLISVLDRRVGEYSDQFRTEYRLFKEALYVDNHLAAVQTPFWGAMQDLTWGASWDRSRRFELRLWLELDLTNMFSPKLILASCTQLNVESSQLLSALPPGQVAEGYRFSIGTGHDGCTAIDELLSSMSSASQPLFSNSQLSRLLMQGIIFFVRYGLGQWRNVEHVPIGMELMAVHTSQCELAEWCLNRSSPPEAQPAASVPIGSNWTLSGPIRFTSDSIEEARRRFPHLALFKNRLIKPVVRMLDRIRMSGETLFLAPRLPKAALDAAEKMTWHYKDTSGRSSKPFRMGFEHGTFVFRKEDAEHLSGTASVTVSAISVNGDEIASTEFEVATFCTTPLLENRPIESSKLVTGDGGQLVPDLVGKCEARPTAGTTDHDTQQSQLGSHKLILPAAEQRPVVTVRSDIDGFPRQWERLFEILCGYFTNVRWLAPNDLFELVRDIFGLDYMTTWETITDLEANQFVRRYFNSGWRGSAYSYVPPKVVHVRDTIRVVGLTGKLFRQKAARDAASLGGNVCFLLDGERPGAIDIELPDSADRKRFLGLLAVGRADREWSRNVIPGWHQLVTFEPESVLSTYNPTEVTYWLPEMERFGSKAENGRTNITLERWRIRNAQSLFILRRGREIWRTGSQDWAIAAYFAASGRVLGYLCRDGSLVCASRRIVLPPSMAEFTLSYGGGVVGRTSEGTLYYPAGTIGRPADLLESWIDGRFLQGSAKAIPLALQRRDLALSVSGYVAPGRRSSSIRQVMRTKEPGF